MLPTRNICMINLCKFLILTEMMAFVLLIIEVSDTHSHSGGRVKIISSWYRNFTIVRHKIWRIEFIICFSFIDYNFFFHLHQITRITTFFYEEILQYFFTVPFEMKSILPQ